MSTVPNTDVFASPETCTARFSLERSRQLSRRFFAFFLENSRFLRYFFSREREFFRVSLRNFDFSLETQKHRDFSSKKTKTKYRDFSLKIAFFANILEKSREFSGISRLILGDTGIASDSRWYYGGFPKYGDVSHGVSCSRVSPHLRCSGGRAQELGVRYFRSCV